MIAMINIISNPTPTTTAIVIILFEPHSPKQLLRVLSTELAEPPLSIGGGVNVLCELFK